MASNNRNEMIVTDISSVDSVDSTSTLEDQVWDAGIEYDTTGVNTGMSRVHDWDPWLQQICNKDEIARINGSLCIYIKESNGWMPMRSSVGLEYIARVSVKFAPVNYEKAVEPIVQTIERNAWPDVYTGPTFTQKAARYTFGLNRDDMAIYFTAVGDGVLPMSKSSYCCIPVNSGMVLKKLPLYFNVPRPPARSALQWITEVFQDNTNAVLWLLGDTIADFGNKRMFIFKGPGGVGKSAIINIITAAMGNTVCNIDPTLTVHNTKLHIKRHLDRATLLKAASARIVLAFSTLVLDGVIHEGRNIMSLYTST